MAAPAWIVVFVVCFCVAAPAWIVGFVVCFCVAAPALIVVFTFGRFRLAPPVEVQTSPVSCPQPVAPVQLAVVVVVLVEVVVVLLVVEVVVLVLVVVLVVVLVPEVIVGESVAVARVVEVQIRSPSWSHPVFMVQSASISCAVHSRAPFASHIAAASWKVAACMQAPPSTSDAPHTSHP